MSPPRSSARPTRAGTKRNYHEDSSPEPEGASPTPGSSKAPKSPKKRIKLDKAETDSTKTKASRPKKAKASKEPTPKQKWDEEIKRRGEWTVDKKYKHQGYPPTFIKSEALKYARRFDQPKLTARELLTLPYETIPNPKDPHYRASHAYSTRDIDRLLAEKAQQLGIDIKAPSPPPPPPPSDNWWDPVQDPLINREYTPPDTAHPEDPPPGDIIWTGEHIQHINLLLEDACLLYCVSKDDLRDLAAHSRWLDRETVAKRAVFLHGGFKRHNEIVVARRKESMDKYEDKVAAAGNYHDGQPAEHYSPYLEALFKRAYEEDQQSSVECESILQERAYPPPSYDHGAEGYRLRVKQFAPMLEYDEGDYGCEWRWTHWHGRGFVGKYDLTA